MDYFYRVYSDPIMRDSFCMGFPECMTSYMTKMNAELSTFPHTYYFSMATGERKQNRSKQRDIFNQPEKIVDASIGFDLQVSQNIKYRNSIGKLRRRQKQNSISVFEQISMYFKISMDPKNFNQKTHTDGHSGKHLGVERLDNRVNA